MKLNEYNNRNDDNNNNMARDGLGKVRLFSWTGPVWLSVLYQVCCPLLPLTFVICYKHLVSLSTLQKKRLQAEGRQRSRGTLWLTPPKMKLFHNLDLFFHLLGLADVMFASPPHTKESYFHVGRETAAVLWNESSHQPGISSSSPARSSSTVGEAADTRPLRQMHVAFTAGGALLFF